MSENIVVVGAGFRGFCACLRLLGRPNTVIHLIDSSPIFGGIMYSRKVNDFYVDNGVQMFDSVPVELADIVNIIMDGKTENIDFVSESAYLGKITKQFSLPDLSSLNLETKNKITAELVHLATLDAHNDNPKNLKALFVERYGETAADIFAEIFENVYLVDPSKVSSTALAHTSLGRLKHLDDEDMLALKEDEWLDTVLAARRKSIGKVDDFVSVYPVDGKGMRGFCEKAVPWLESQGVKIGLKQNIESFDSIKDRVKVKTNKQVIDANYVVWANDNVEVLAELLDLESPDLDLRHSTSMVLMTFVTKKEYIKDFTYLQNFGPESSVYRVASAGHYGRQYTRDGLSFITCECPAVIDSENWVNAESWSKKVWEECKLLKVVDENAELSHVDVFRAPKTHRLPLVGFESFISDISGHIEKNINRILFQGMELFNRRQIYMGSEYLKDL